MITDVELIDVEKAKEYLEHNVDFKFGQGGTNRQVSLNTINNYAAAMLRGEWRLTHQGIAFGWNGKLLDGQQRLKALIVAAEEGVFDLPKKEDIAIEFSVSRDVDPAIFPVVDTGRNRDAGQILAMQGHANSMLIASAARLLFLFDNVPYSGWRRTRVNNTQVDEVVRNTNITDFVPMATGLRPIGIIASAATTAMYVTNRAFPDGPHEKFIDALRHGVDLDVDDPRLTFRNYLIRSKSVDRTRREAVGHMAMYIKAWNDFVRGERRNAISFRATEKMPNPVTGTNGSRG